MSHAFSDDNIIGDYEISDTIYKIPGFSNELKINPGNSCLFRYYDYHTTMGLLSGHWFLNKDTLCVYDSLIRTQFDDAPYFVIQPDGYRIQKKINSSSNGIHIKIMDAKNQAIKGYKIKYYCDSSADYSSNENGDIFIKRYPNDDVYDYYTLNFTLPFPNYPVQRSLPVEKKFNDITLNIDPVYTHDFIQITKRYYLVKDGKLMWLYFKQEGTCFFNYDQIDFFFSFKKK
jgi:hypothetical protein